MARVVLIGGTSHVGKSTLALALASRLRWPCLSTDALARHPGHPWHTDRSPIPAHVAAHYRSLSIEELFTEQLSHYERLWPTIEALVLSRAANADPLVLEGSGVLPARVAALKDPNIAAVWLTADADTLRERIYSASRFTERSADEQLMIEKFLGRTQRFDEVVVKAANRLGLAVLDVSTTPPPDELVDYIRGLRA